uniref:Major facilitator superfamily (MFS) profile domain-containing protein n=1 Tax=Plectus sambesii TaxID=2011161 RepID=A0A914W2C2_9BILA
MSQPVEDERTSGRCGKLQINRFHWIVFFTWQLSIYFAGQQLFNIFGNYSPKYRCRGEGNETSEFVKNCALLEACPVDQREFEEAAFYSTALEFDMVCGKRAHYSSLISSMQFFGVLIGTIFYGHLADKFGRKPISLLCLTLGILFVMLTAVSPGWVILMILRFLVGSSIGGTVVVVYTYVMELILPQQRVFLRAFFNWGWGRVALTLVCALFPSWRIASVVSGALLLPILPIIYFVFPESPMWLENKGRFDEMLRSEAKIARIAGIPPLKHRKKHDAHRESEATGKTYGIWDLFANRAIAQRTLILCLIWFIASVCSYTNDLNSSTLAGNFYVNQILFGVMIALSKLVIFVLDTYVPQFSRRLLHQIPQAFVVVCFAAISVILIFGGATLPVLLLNLVGTIFIEYTWDACYLSGAEGFPTEVRAIGVGTCSLTARVGALLAPQLAFLGTLWIPSPYVAVALFSLITLVLSCIFLPETKGSDLAVRDNEISLTHGHDNPKEEAVEML